MKSLKNGKIKVLCAMSGGVDSSVAAALLVKQGYDVTGVFMVNYDEPVPQKESCWSGDYQDALRVAAKIGIPLLRLDFVKEYKKQVLDYMYLEYESGRTPNPDVLCNKYIKFGAWLEKAKELGFNFLATGHYAGLKKNTGNKYELLTAADTNKDQTYFLHQLDQQQLQHVLFPVGEYTKEEVRKMAKKFDLQTAEKEESMGICFVGEVPMKEFLMKKIKPHPGKIVSTGGKVLGEHDGLAFYTIGERGIGVKDDSNRPFYVTGKNTETNELIVGYEDVPALFKKEIFITDVNWISGHEPKYPLKCEVRLRHRQDLQKATVEKDSNGLKINFIKSQRAATPGQFAVFYKAKKCLGGGVIN